ncbi:MAG: ACP S-malonyltransferase, partial [Dehalococcoidia bacterium]
ITPAFVAGHSVGEYTALAAVDSLMFSDGLRLVQERARLMHEAGIKSPGGMAAVIGLDMVSLEEICQETGTQIANINSPGQIVVSGTNNGLAWMMDLAKARGAKRVIRLDVSGGFHSFLMEPVTGKLADAVNQLDFSHPRVPVVANVTARPVHTAQEIRTGIIKQICGCVQWQPSIVYMINEGVDTFVEIGPGQVLTGLIKRINRDVTILNVREVNDLSSVAEKIQSQGSTSGAKDYVVAKG